MAGAMPPVGTGSEHFSFVVDKGFKTTVSADWIVIGLAVIVLVSLAVWRYGGWRAFASGLRHFDIEEAQLGLGDQRITLRPNDVDRQIAYQIWVELSTRKIGLEIDLEDDVLVEIYDSWHTFFQVTRELIKDVPVSKFRRKDTEKIIRLSIDVLNAGIRPHLTKWQARFRRWYDRQLNLDDHVDLEPQMVQMRFPAMNELRAELAIVNGNLIAYRKRMHALVTGL
jgi:hypothetical protein